jgi:hypothetical protein
LENHLATFKKLQPALMFLQMMEINQTLASQGAGMRSCSSKPKQLTLL